jgi:hypothetical protein
VIGEWTLPIGTFDCKQEFVNLRQVISWQTTVDVEVSHNAQAIGVTR